MFATNPLGKLFNRPRKSRSTPNRRALTEYLNKVTAPLHSEFQHQQQNHLSYTFPPTTNKSHSQRETTYGVSSGQTITPMLIATSFQSQDYPFDDNDSLEETEHIYPPVQQALHSSSPQQYYNQQQQQQQQIPETVMPPYVQHQHSSSNPYPTTSTEHINIPSQQNSLYFKERENISYNDSFYTQASQPQQTVTQDSPIHRTFKRIPTPYAYRNSNEEEEDDDEEEYNAYQDYRRDYQQAEDISGFQQLKNDFKKLEKKHKRKEKRVQELEYLLFSRSFESTLATTAPANEYASTKYFTTSPQSWVDPPTLNSSHSYPYRSPDYYYNNYGGDYYYANHTPSSYQRYPSAGPSFSNSSRHNLNSNSDTKSNGHRYSHDSVADNSFTDDSMLRQYYIQQQQQRYYSLMRSSSNEIPTSKNNKKRWTQ